MFQVCDIGKVDAAVKSEFDFISIQGIAKKQGDENLGTGRITDKKKTRLLVFLHDNKILKSKTILKHPNDLCPASKKSCLSPEHKMLIDLVL